MRETGFNTSMPSLSVIAREKSVALPLRLWFAAQLKAGRREKLDISSALKKSKKKIKN
jgi:hypothetical protein